MTHTSPEDQSRIDAIEQALLARWPETRIEPTLERIAALVDMLGSPQLTYPTIHIGGTNGKTTTSRMIDSLLFEMGLRTGRFTSPHLESYLERIAINGQPIDAKALIFSFNDISAYFDLMDLVREQKQFAWHNEPDWSSAWYDTSAELQ
jgi:dihydrofolate synthase/folylpolyglutamate synthase